MTGRRGGQPTRRAIMTGAFVACAVMATLAFAYGRDSSDAAPQGVVAAAAITPAPEGITTPRAIATEIATEAPTPVLTDAATAAPSTPFTTITPTIDGAWSATPYPTTTQPTTGPAASAASLASSLATQYSVRILTSGQNWGSDEASQVRNLNALGAALASVPAGVRAAIAANPGGPLAFLSNDSGSTEAGWQPYGTRQANYYTNEDVAAGANIAANEIVLQPGSTAQTIAHEMMHAFQLRDQAPGDYAGALLDPEMQSFMAATGWTQNVSDAQVRTDATRSWEALDADFTYTGRTLTYAGADGSMLSLYAPNPLEGYAEAGGLYYAHSAATALPDWAEYWGWFSATVG